ncbi:hypothetical protein [Albidovulum sp.]|uniref:hypothetical protein n=1 Tax=Albidovulum sp. TaxID=1872424 RepID=UPI0039B82732
MSELRSLIRQILAEEIAALRSENLGGPQVERVRAGSEAELTEFALSVLARAQDAGFAAALSEGRIRFAPEAPAAAPPRAAYVPPASPPLPQPAAAAQPMTLVTTLPARVPELLKGLITERDIAGIAEGETRLRISKTARLTPLAGDEARRRGLRIERTSA